LRSNRAKSTLQSKQISGISLKTKSKGKVQKLGFAKLMFVAWQKQEVYFVWSMLAFWMLTLNNKVVDKLNC
jgi:hypothetical protein